MAGGKWLKIVLCLIAVFAAGGLTGYMAAMHDCHRAMHRHIDVPKFSERIMRHLDSKLKLTADQKEKIRPIIIESLQKQQAIHEQAHNQIQAAREDSHNKIMPLLNSDQQTRMDELYQKWKSREHDDEASSKSS